MLCASPGQRAITTVVIPGVLLYAGPAVSRILDNFYEMMFKIFLALLSLLCLTGCALVPPLAPVDLKEPGWTVREGQAVYHPKHGTPEIAGDLLVATRADRAFVQLAKNPFPIAVAQSTANAWQLELPLQNKRYSGPGKPPKRLIFLYLPRVLAGQPPPKGWTWRTLPNHGWRLENPATGEFLEGFLAP
jgi:hypothetical protein